MVPNNGQTLTIFVLKKVGLNNQFFAKSNSFAQDLIKYVHLFALRCRNKYLDKA